MYPLPDPSSEAEQSAREHPEHTWEVVSQAVIALIGLAGSALIVRRLLSSDDDELQLHVLHGTIRVLHSMARFFGTAALNAENTYNDYVETLH
jgi:hypothetical protein